MRQGTRRERHCPRSPHAGGPGLRGYQGETHPLPYRCLCGQSARAGDLRKDRSYSPGTRAKHTEDVYSQPLCRRDFQQIDPPLRGAGLLAAVPRDPRSRAPRYYIVNERDSRQKTHPTFWPERRFRMEASGDIVEMCPRTPRPGVSWAHQQGPSPQLSEEEEGVLRRELVRRSLHPLSLRSLQGAPHFHVSDRSEGQSPAPEHQGRPHFRSLDDGFGAPLDRPVAGHKKLRSRNLQSTQHPPMVRGKPEVEPSLSESDSMSAASSSDQQTSGNDRPLQIAPGQPRFPRSVSPPGRRKAVSRQELIVDLNDLICSNV